MIDISKVGIVCCSNGQLPEYKEEINRIIGLLEDMGISVELSDFIYVKEGVSSGTPKERAKALNDFYRDNTIDAIFDISGGDIANEILPFLDYDVIRESNIRFYGYSDLTTIINAIYAMTGNSSVLYQVKNLVWDKTGIQQKNFTTDKMYKYNYNFIEGTSMSGVVVGGNIRCLLKLAGTKYFPDMSGKILLLESLGGMEPQIATYFAQLYQLGVFDKVNGVLLGTFTEIEKNGKLNVVMDMAKKYIGDRVPIAMTSEIGHQSTSKALVIGENITLSNSFN